MTKFNFKTISYEDFGFFSIFALLLLKRYYGYIC